MVAVANDAIGQLPPPQPRAQHGACRAKDVWPDAPARSGGGTAALEHPTSASDGRNARGALRTSRAAAVAAHATTRRALTMRRRGRNPVPLHRCAIAVKLNRGNLTNVHVLKDERGRLIATADVHAGDGRHHVRPRGVRGCRVAKYTLITANGLSACNHRKFQRPPRTYPEWPAARGPPGRR